MRMDGTEEPKSPWWKKLLEALRALAAGLAVVRFLLWLARWFLGFTS